jgi:hypothetical protein
MGYDNAKIYQLVCEDGHYYYGSTINELRVRLGGHKKASLTQPYRVYKHINCVGWETVKIVLVECFPCENRQELNKKENEYISANKSDPMCLNNNLAFLTEEERLEKKRIHGEQNKEKLAEYHKKKRTGNPEVAEYQRQYRKRNEESIKESKKKYYAEHKEEDNQRCLERYYANREEILRRKREKYNERKNSNRTDRT